MASLHRVNQSVSTESVHTSFVQSNDLKPYIVEGSMMKTLSFICCSSSSIETSVIDESSGSGRRKKDYYNDDEV